MLRLELPEVADDIAFLTDTEQPNRLYRLPAPPAALDTPGTPDVRLTLYRRDLRHEDASRPSQGGVLTVLLDTAPLSERFDRAEIAVRARRGFSPQTVEDVSAESGEASLFLGDRCLCTIDLGPAADPVVPLATHLTPDFAALLAAAHPSDPSSLSVTIRRDVSVAYGGPRLTITVDPAAAAQAPGPFPGADLEARLSSLRAAGHVRVEAAEPLEMLPPAATALIAGALFSPAPGADEGWSAIFGLTRTGALVPRTGPPVTWTLEPGATVLVPLFSVARLSQVPAANIARVEPPSSRIGFVRLWVPAMGKDELEAATVDVSLPDGSERALMLHRAEQQAVLDVAYVAAPGKASRARVRYDLRYTDGATETVDLGEIDGGTVVLTSRAMHGRWLVLAPWLAGQAVVEAVEVELDVAGTSKTLLIHRAQAASPAQVALDHLADGHPALRWRARYFFTDGTPPVELSWAESRDAILVVPHPPKQGG